ncbi:MAG: 5'-methylthioadenosine/adenosylhomocysteine nucleosidase [Candidatus Izemoplasma sp.]|nr:5'-methylthioadenosine/adenosylhomocysteine nucleosidase [Candidatus Izemoplasma sp.]
MIGIIGAMEEELTELLRHTTNLTKTSLRHKTFYEGTIHNHNVVLALAGIGKVNAAITATLLFEHYDIDHLINIGVAGGQNGVTHKDIIIGTEILYHDVDVTKFDRYVHGQIPGQTPTFIADKDLVKLAEKAGKTEKLPVYLGKIASGDQFVYDKKPLKVINNQYPDILAIEMEAAAIAHVCSHYDKPFLVLRSISDVIEDYNQHVDFESFLSDAVKNVSKVLLDVIKSC